MPGSGRPSRITRNTASVASFEDKEPDVDYMEIDDVESHQPNLEEKKEPAKSRAAPKQRPKTAITAK